jgi:hypothetical protein
MSEFLDDVPTMTLRDGERIVWRGRPDPSKHFTKADLFIVPFSILWAGLFFVVAFPALIRGIAHGRGEPIEFVFMSIFLVVPLYITVGRFVVKAAAKRKREYVLTNQRAVIVSSGKVSQDVMLRNAAVSTEITKDGMHATVRFSAPSGPSGMDAGNLGLDLFGRNSATAFYDVKNPQQLLSALPTS